MAQTQIWISAYQSLGGIPRLPQSESVLSWMPSLAGNKKLRGSDRNPASLFLGASFPGDRTARRFSYSRMQVCGVIIGLKRWHRNDVEDNASLFPGSPFLVARTACRAFAAVRWRQTNSDQVPTSLFLGASFAGRRTIKKSGYGHVQVCRSFVGVKWWKKLSASNMHDINSAQELIEALTNAGEKLVIVEFFGTWCGTCRALHPKLCQIAEENPDVVFLKVNFELNKKLCSSLDVKVLPLFHFYRGAGGRLDSFSCSLSTVQRLRNAIAKHNTDRCSIGPTFGVGDKLLRLPVDNVPIAAAI